MPRSATVLDVLIASPGDVTEERQAVRNAIHDWNNQHSRRGCIFHPVMWETHSTPEFGESPQAILNRQVVDHCDAVVGIFGTRLGSPTDVALSGTVEEIERLHAAGKRVMVYFSSKPVNPDSIDVSQLEALRGFQQRCRRHCLYSEFATASELAGMVSRALTALAEQWSPRDLAAEASAGKDANNTSNVDPTMVSDLRKLSRRWVLNQDSGGPGVAEGKRLSREFVDWYVDHAESLQDGSQRWTTLAKLATQLTGYNVDMSLIGHFYSIGRAIFDNALLLLDTGQLLKPTSDVDERVLRCVQGYADYDKRVSAETIAADLSLTADEVQLSLAALQEADWIDVARYSKTSDYATTGAGLVCSSLLEATDQSPPSGE